MKYIKIYLFAALALMMAACGSDNDVDTANSIFSTDSISRNAFDKWLLANYVNTYNLEFKYKYEDKETHNTYNVVPVETEKAVAMAILVKHVWLEAYKEVLGDEFLKTYVPRQLQLIGSWEINSTTGERTLGVAEGGVKVYLTGINKLDIDHPVFNFDIPWNAEDWNSWYFHTMHHEFCHILTQKKEYSTDFRAVSAGKFNSSNWINVKDTDAVKKGFVTSYGSSEYNEDFAEIYSMYVTHSEAGWNTILSKAVDGDDVTGRTAIEAKLKILREYFANSWKLNIDTLRAVVLRRSAEVKNLDLRTLK
jgi:substrate import-associated zinc metallohydrolase lipoprotein